MKYCPKCGAEVHPGQAFCTQCGYKLKNSSKASQPPVTNESDRQSNFPNVNNLENNKYEKSLKSVAARSHRPVKIAIIALIFILVLGGVWFVHHKLESFHHQVWGSIMRVQDTPQEVFYIGNYKNSRYAIAKHQTDLPTDMDYISKKQCLNSLAGNQNIFDSSGMSEKEMFEDFDMENTFQDTNSEITYYFRMKPKNAEGRLLMDSPVSLKIRFYDIKKLANKRWYAKGELIGVSDGERHTQTLKSVSIVKVN